MLYGLIALISMSGTDLAVTMVNVVAKGDDIGVLCRRLGPLCPM